MLTIEIEFKDGRRIETEEGEVSDFNFPWGDNGNQFVTIHGKNGELLYAINASEILVMAVDYGNDEVEEKGVEESFNALSHALEDSTVDSADALSEIQKFLQTNGFTI